MKAIVTGMIASYPVGGVVWDYGQYAVGLERLGYEVYYLEDTGWQTYDPRRGEYGEDCTYAVEFLGKALDALSPSLGTRWRFRNLDGRTFGLGDDAFGDVILDAQSVLAEGMQAVSLLFGVAQDADKDGRLAQVAGDLDIIDGDQARLVDGQFPADGFANFALQQFAHAQQSVRGHRG